MSEMVLRLPNSFVDVEKDEMEYIDGGIAPAAVIGIIVGCMAIGGGLYAIGRAAGDRVYYSGYSNTQYQQNKWFIRAGVIASLGVVVGGIVMTGFENEYYAKVTGK